MRTPGRIWVQRSSSPCISADNLNWKEDTSSCLGCGAFGAVYLGKMKRGEKSHTVALKVYNEVLDDINATLFMAEVQMLR